MSATAHDAIIAALVAQLQAAASGPGNELAGALIAPEVDFDDLPEDLTRAVLVQLLRSRAAYPYTAGGPRKWATLLRITCGARGDTMAGGNGRTSSRMLAAVEAAIATSPDLGGLLQRPLQLDELSPDQQRSFSLPGVLDAVYSCEHETGATSL